MFPDGQICQKTFGTEAANCEHRRSVHTLHASIRYLGDERIIDRSADGYFRCPAGDLECKDSQELWRHANKHHPAIPPYASPSPTPAGPTTRDASPAMLGDESNPLPPFSNPKQSRKRKRTSSAAEQSSSVPFSPNTSPDSRTLTRITDNCLPPLSRTPEKSPPDVFPELIQIGIVVHCPTKLVICIECSSVVHHTHVRTHAINHSFKPVHQTHLEEIFSSLGCTDTPILPNLPTAPIPGLAIHDGYRCAVDGCGRLTVKYRTMQDHFATTHPLLHAKDHTESKHLHRIGEFRGNQELIVVDPTLSLPVPMGTFEDYLEKIGYVQNVVDKPYTPSTDVKFYDGFLAASRWYKLVINQDISTLVALVSLPSDRETTLKLLVSEVKHWLRSICTLAEDLDITFLRWVNTAKGEISNTPFRKPQTEDYLDRCARMWARFLCMVLRSMNDPVTFSTFPVPLSDDHSDAARTLMTALETGRTVVTAISTLSFLFVSSYLAQVATDRTKSPFYQFLVLYHLHPDGRFDQPHAISPNLAMLQLCIRASCIEQGYRLVGLELEYHDLLTVYHEYLYKFLTEGTHHIFSMLLEQFHLVASFAYSETRMPMLQWNLSHSVLAVRGSPLVVDDLKIMVASLFTSAEDVLGKILMGSDMSQFDAIVKESLDTRDATKWPKDDLRNQEVGYSFLHSPDNPYASHFNKVLSDIHSNPSLFAEFHVRTERGLLQPRPGTIHRWLDKVAELTDLVFALSHILSAGPARGTELETYRFVNANVGPRTFFFIMGYGVFVARYAKTRSVTGQDRLVPRFIPYRLTRLVAYLIGPLRMTANAFISHINSKPPNSEDLVFVRWGMPMSSIEFSQVLRHVTTQHLNLEMGLRDYRQVIKAILRQVINIDLDHEDANDDPIDTTFGHSASTSRSTYGLTWDDMPHVTGNMFHDVLKMVRRWLNFLGVETSSEPLGGPSKPLSGEPVLRLSEAIDKMDKTMLEARNVADLLRDTPRQMQQDILDRIDLMGSELKGQIEGLNIHNNGTTSTPHSGHSPLVDVSPARVIGLRALFSNGDLDFKSIEQAQATEILARGYPHLLVVLKTGGGKTATYMSLCFAEEDGVRVVIIPYSSLFEEMTREAQRRCIAYGTWPSSDLNIFTARLIFVRLESTHNSQFIPWLKGLKNSRLLRGLVIDEAHDTLVSRDYRTAFHSLRLLAQVNAHITMLTGTLSPQSETALCEAMNIDRQSLHVVRQATYRAEIGYQIIQVNPGEVVATLKHAMEGISLSSIDRGLIYVMSVSRAREIAGEMGLQFYTGPSSATERTSASQAWRDGKSPWLVCTLAFAQGIDYPHVRAVITCDVAFKGDNDMHECKVLGMVHLSQMAGRAGRDGKPAKHITIVSQQPSAGAPFPDHLGTAATVTFITKTQCRRLAMTAFLDGEAVNCASIPNSQHCDVCLRRAAILPHQLFYQSPTGSKLRARKTFTEQCIPVAPTSPTPAHCVHADSHTRFDASTPQQSTAPQQRLPPPPQSTFMQPPESTPHMPTPGPSRQPASRIHQMLATGVQPESTSHLSTPGPSRPPTSRIHQTLATGVQPDSESTPRMPTPGPLSPPASNPHQIPASHMQPDSTPRMPTPGPSRPTPSRFQQTLSAGLPRMPAASPSFHAMLEIEKPTTLAEKRHYLSAWCASRYLKCSACYFYNSSSGPAHQYLWSCGFQLAQNRDYVSFKSCLHFSGTSEPMCYKCLIPYPLHLTRTINARGVDKEICKYDDLLKPFLFLVYHDPVTRQRVLEALGISPNQFTSAAQYCHWLGLSENDDDMMYNALEVILTYLDLKRNNRLPDPKVPGPPVVICY